MDGWTDGPAKWGVESRSTQLKIKMTTRTAGWLSLAMATIFDIFLCLFFGDSPALLSTFWGHDGCGTTVINEVPRLFPYKHN